VRAARKVDRTPEFLAAGHSASASRNFPATNDPLLLEGCSGVRDLALAREAGHLLGHKSKHLRNEMTVSHWAVLVGVAGKVERQDKRRWVNENGIENQRPE